MLLLSTVRLCMGMVIQIDVRIHSSMTSETTLRVVRVELECAHLKVCLSFSLGLFRGSLTNVLVFKWAL